MTKPLPSAPAAPGTSRPTQVEACWLVVINHHEARIFRGMTPETDSVQVRPDQSEEGIRHRHSLTGFSRGQEKPEEHTFFRPVADALADATSFLIFGSGTGTANEMNQFIAWLRTHNANTAGRIAGVEIIDEHHLTDAQLLARARAYRERPTESGPAPSGGSTEPQAQ